jgi:hypothetical protein
MIRDVHIQGPKSTGSGSATLVYRLDLVQVTTDFARLLVGFGMCYNWYISYVDWVFQHGMYQCTTGMPRLEGRQPERLFCYRQVVKTGFCHRDLSQTNEQQCHFKE